MKIMKLLPALLSGLLAVTLSAWDQKTFNEQLNAIRNTLGKEKKYEQAAQEALKLASAEGIPLASLCGAYAAAGDYYLQAKNYDAFEKLCRELHGKPDNAQRVRDRNLCRMLLSFSKSDLKRADALFSELTAGETPAPDIAANWFGGMTENSIHQKFTAETDRFFLRLLELKDSPEKYTQIRRIFTVIRHQIPRSEEKYFGMLEKHVSADVYAMIRYLQTGEKKYFEPLYLKRDKNTRPAEGLFLQSCRTLAGQYQNEGEYAKAEEVWKDLNAHDPKSCWNELAMLELRREHDREAAELFDKADRNAPWFDLHYYPAVMRGLCRGLSVAEAEKAMNMNGVSSAKRMKLLSQVSKRFFDAGRYEYCRLIFREIQSMLQPVEEKGFTCRFLSDPPTSVWGWNAREDLRRDPRFAWNGFEPYGIEIFTSPANDERRLADRPREKVDPAWLSTLCLAYDEQGLHVYMDCPDPDAEKIHEGFKDPGSLEFLFQPDRNAAYHMIACSLPDGEDPYEVDWESPGRHYRLTYDGIRKTAALTPRGTGAYLFIPWLQEYDRLPFDGHEWRLGVQRWCGKSQTTGGRVHELSRTLKLSFEITPEMKNRIRRFIAAKAVRQYRRLRKDADGFLAHWQDADTGDPEFFEKVIEPHLKMLDDACAELESMPAGQDVTEFFRRYVPQLLELKYDIADLRTDYLKKHFMQQ